MKLLYVFAILLASVGTQAQSLGRIAGNIKNGSQQAVIDAATISLLRAHDSVLVKSSIAEKDGSFVFEAVKFGKYRVMASSVGYAQTYSNLIEIDSLHLHHAVGTLQLVAQARELTNVTVTSKKPLIERKADRTVVNVEAMLTAAGGNAMELLEKSPGVTVDKDGNLSLKGKPNVTVFIDGKPSYMSGSDLVNYLNNMPAANLESIEIMPNPPAQYDAAGNSGVINIKTKRNKLKGFNGSITNTIGYGRYPKTNNSLNLNYRNKKINLYSTFGANYRREIQSLEIYREFLSNSKELTGVFSQQNTERRERQFYNSKIGMDYFLSNKTTLGLSTNIYLNPFSNPSTNINELRNQSGSIDSIVRSIKTEDGQWQHVGTNFNLRHKFDSTGRELTTDVDYLYYSTGKDQLIDNKNYNAAGELLSTNGIKGNLPATIRIFSVKTDYTQMVGKKWKMDAGLKTAFVATENKANYFLVNNGTESVDYGRTNYFDYQENINAAYINFSTQLKKWNLQTGLRAENTNYKGHQYGNSARPDSSFERSYISLFPTTYLTYKHNDNHEFGINIGRRINRPDYEDLNPFYYFLDQYTYEVGNTRLLPSFANTLELSHTYKGFLTSTLELNQTNRMFAQSFNREDKAIVIRAINFGKMQTASLSISAQVPVQKWWTAQVYTQGVYNRIEGLVNESPVDVSMSTFLINITNQFKLSKGWNAELSGFFRTRGNEGQIIVNPVSQMSMALQKQILKTKGSLKLAFSDFTGPMVASGTVAQLQNMNANFRQFRDTRQVRLTFNYRFGKVARGENRKRGGSSEEQSRVGGEN